MRSAAVLLALLAACPAPSHPTADPNLRLVVVLVIDQLPEWSFELKQPALTGGFRRLLAEGEWHVGRHPSAATLTAPGHALIGTGEPPARSGILGNEWWHRDLGKSLAATEAEDGSVSAKWLRVAGLGDAVAAAATGAKAVGVSLKDRAAILPLGHRGLSIWYDSATARWTSLTPAPAWLTAWNASHPVAARLHEPWTPLDPQRLAELTGTTDDQPGEVGEKGFGPTFPHDPQATKNPADAILAMPLGNELVLDTAGAAIDGEQLGTDATPDVLVISLSAHDYVSHGWGQESWEAWDLMLRLDARLGAFLDELDRKVGAGRWAMVVTSDHGASPLPERVGGGRLTHKQIQGAANAAASAVLGPGAWIDNAHYPFVVFSRQMLAQPAGELASATRRVIYALRSFPGLERVDRVGPLVGTCDQRKPADRVVCLMFDPERSGDVFYLPASGWIMQSEDEPLATAHGSAHDYDRLVPLVLLAPGRTPHPAAAAPGGELPMTEVAPLVARWLGIAPPNAPARSP